MEEEERKRQAERKRNRQAGKALAAFAAALGNAIAAQKHQEFLTQLGGDVYDILRVASKALQKGHYELASELYLRAIAIGIPNPKDSAIAKWEYADVLWRRGWLQEQVSRSWLDDATRTLDGRAGARYPTLPADVRHYLVEAENDLRRHLRSAPHDLDGLRLLHKIGLLFERDTTAVEEQMKLLEVRQSMTPAAAPLRDADRSGVSFENKCLGLIRVMRFHAELTKATADGGIDIIAFQPQPLLRGKYVIQCKDWANPVGEPVLRDLLGTVAAEDAVKGILITSSTFTEAAKRFAQGKRLELIDGRDLDDLSAQFQQHADDAV